MSLRLALALVLALVAVTMTALAPAARADRTPGELVHYRFTEGSGATVGDSGSGAPLDLAIADPGNTTWVPGGGLTVDAATTITSGVAAGKVSDAVKSSGAVSVEAWITPANTTQDGPARIVSISQDSLNRNVTLAQGQYGKLAKTVFDARLRTTAVNNNGQPSTTTPAGSISTELTHVVFTRSDDGTTTVFLDGVAVVTGTAGGTLANWSGSFPLLLGNEAEGNRPWLGTFCEVAIYDVALTTDQVGDNFGAGCVVGANADPVVTDPGEQSSAEGDVVSLAIEASDADGDVLSFAAANLPDGLSIDPSTGVVTGTVAQTAADGSPYAVTVTVDDGRGGSGSVSFDWAVSAVNVAPVLDVVGDRLSSQDVTLSVTVSASDVDGDDLVFDASGLPDGLSIDGVSGEISGTPSVQGVFDTTVSVSDGDLSDEESLSWTIVGNDPPVLDPFGDQDGGEGDVESLTVTATDPDGDDLVFGATGLPDGLAIDAATGAITGTVSQTAAEGSPYATTVTVDDGLGGTDEESLTWTIAAVNVAPVLAPIADQSDDVGDSVSLTVSASDVDGDDLSFDATGLPDGLSIDPATGTITGTIAAGAEAGSPYTTTVSVDDGGATDEVALVWTVSIVTGPQPLVAYDFTEGSGATVGDSGSGAPLDLTIANPGNTTWVPGGGLTVDAATTITSGVAASKVSDAVKSSGAVSVEAWITPANTTQDGPARIVSISQDSLNRNVTLAQGQYGKLAKTVFDARLRTTAVNNNGQPSTTTPAGSISTELTHVVFTRSNDGTTTVFLDGVAVVTGTAGGTLANWSGSFPLLLGNEAEGNRPWLGTFCEVAIYDVALTTDQVGDNFADRCGPDVPPAALVQITPGSGIDATTYGNATITVTNQGAAGAPEITAVDLDLGGSLIPDATFDPVGTAGDEGTQCLDVSVEGGTGFQVPADPCTDPFSLPHQDAPGIAGNGWDGMSLGFDDFDDGESIVFGVDVDPTTIQGNAGSGGAGAVSGLELSGSLVTVTFDDGSALTSQLFGDGSIGGAEARVSSDLGQVAPTGIQMLGVTTTPTVFPNDSVAGMVPEIGPQTVRVSGPTGADVVLLAVVGDVPPDTAFDVDDFESDAASQVTYLSATIGAGGRVDIPVTIGDDTKLHHFVAAIDDGDEGLLSQILVIGVGDTGAPVLAPIDDVTVDEGETVAIDLQAVDSDGDDISLSFSDIGLADLGAIFTDNGDGTGSIVWDTEAGDAGVYEQYVSAIAGGESDGQFVTITVIDPTATPPGQALVQVTPGGSIGASTYGAGSITIANTGADGAPAIESIAFDLRGSIIPDATLDPNGDAGDATAKCVEINSGGAATGYVTPADPCTTPFGLPHEDSPGVVGNGFDGMTLEFTDFDASETLGLAIDIDPTTIQGVAGSGGAGSVSGLELVGSDATVTFDDGRSVTAQVIGDGSAGGGQAILSTIAGVVPSGIEMVGLATAPTVFTNGSSAGNVAATGPQTIRVAGPVGADVTVLELVGDQPAANAFDPDPFESDTASAVNFLSAVIPASGVVDIDVDIADASKLYHYVATIDGSSTSLTSQILVVGVGEPVAPSDVLYRVNAGGPVVAATDGGPDWTADQSSAAGGTAVTGTPSPYLFSGSDTTYGTADAIDLGDPSVPAGTPAALFQTERYDDAEEASEMVYEFPVGAGQGYTVDLFFAENFAETNDFREFGVEVEGVSVLDAYDIHELVGHDAGVVATIQTGDVADDFLTITFLHQVQNPKVSAIEVRGAGAPVTDQPPVVDAIADTSVQLGNSLVVPITTSEVDGDAITLGWSSDPDAASFTNFVDNANGNGTLTFAPEAGDTGVYELTVTATDKDGSDDEVFTVTVTEPPVAGTVFARINAGGPQVAAVDGGPVWDADTAAAAHPFLTDPGSGQTNGFAVTPGATVPDTVPAGVFTTERWSSSGFGYGIPVPAGTQVHVRVLAGNGYDGTDQVGERVFDVSVDGVVVADDLDLVDEFGNLTGGMLEELVTSDGTVDIDFANVVENPLVNAIEVVSAESTPDTLGASPATVDFGSTLVNGSKNQAVSLTNLGFEVGDPAIDITDVTVSGGEFTTNFSGPVTVGAGGSTTLQVSFSPTSVGAQTGTLSVTHSGSNTPLQVALSGVGDSDIPVSFSAGGLSGESSSNPTSLQFGPDGRLYVTQQNATVYAYTVQRNGVGDYSVTATEQIDLVQDDTPNHNDDGSANGTSSRQSTGLLVAGTAANPVLYVTSSDSRISVGDDSGLDTNSGVVSRLSWTGSEWDKVDIVRGLPRSEENHSTNGMALDPDTNTLFVMQGGHANKGAPGNNFSGTPEYYLSAAMLQVDLDAIAAMPVTLDDRSGTQVIYDLPTLDDPDRADIDNTDANFPFAPGHPRYDDTVDVGDPFGGNNGQNQAVPEPGGPVQIYSPGYRNAYDVVFTENGRLYTSDNGPNSGWGGVPFIYASDGTSKGFGESGVFDQAAGDYCTNEFNDGGSQAHGDPLHFVDGEGYYGGHPAPIRAFPGKSGVFIYEEGGSGWFEAAAYDFADLLPNGLTLADFPDNPIECDYTANDPAQYIDIINASTNGITEYAASNFGGSLQGNILTASFDGNIYSYGLNAAGDAALDKEALFGGFGSQPLDVIAQGDDDPFPGTVWSATYGADTITVFEPLDFGTVTCEGTDDPALDEDNDGYTNADEIDNGTNPCSAGSQPNDNDGDGVSDLNDADDDDDGIPDVDDAFAIDPDNGTTTSLPVSRPFTNGDPGTGFFGLGLTGLMTNGTTDYLDQFDPANLDAGGATGKLSVETVTAGDAYQADNTQDNGFLYGIDVDDASAPFVVQSKLESPFFGGLTPQDYQSMGVFIGPGDQDNYLKVVMNANAGAGGVQVLLEEAGAQTVGTTYGPAVTGDLLGAGSVDLSMVVDPAALTAQARVAPNGGTPVDLGAPVSLPAAWFDGTDGQGLAVGVISTATQATGFTAAWDNLDVTWLAGASPSIAPVADVTVTEGDTDSVVVDIVDPDGDPVTIDVASTPDVAGFTTQDVVDNDPGDYTLTLDLAPADGDAGDYDVTVSADDATNPAVEESFTVTVIEPVAPSDVLYRVNTGGPEIAAADVSSPAWAADTDAAPSPYRTAGGDNTYEASAGTAHPGPVVPDASVPASVPLQVFEIERWDPPAGDEMQYQFPVDAGSEVEVRLLFAELYNEVDTAGERVFDVALEGAVPGAFDDIDAFAVGGAKGGFMLSATTTVIGDTLDVEFLHDVIENPAIKGIEVLLVSPPSDDTPPTIAPIDDQVVTEGDSFALGVVASDDNAVDYALTGDVPTGMTIDAAGQVTWEPGLADSGRYTLAVEVSDGVNAPVSESFTLDVTQGDPGGAVLHRVNVGGAATAAADASAPDWAVDNAANPSPLRVAGSNNIYGPGVGISDMTHPTVPASAPIEVFEVERYDAPTDDEMAWAFPVAAGTEVEVRILFAELFSGIDTPGERLIDVTIDDVVVETGIAPYDEVGNGVAIARDYLVTSDGTVDIVFPHNVENPAIKGIEILEVGGGVPTVAITAPADGATVDGDEVTVEWDLGGVLDANDHVHVSVDDEPHVSVFRPETSLLVTGLADGPHTITVEVANFAHEVYPNPGASDAVDITVEAAVEPQDPVVVDAWAHGDVLHRVNAGGPEVAAADGGVAWGEDRVAAGNGGTATTGTESPLLDAAYAAQANGEKKAYGSADPIIMDGSVPAGVPTEVFQAERWDPPTGIEMGYDFPVPADTMVEVRVYLAELYQEGTPATPRVFDIQVDGNTVVADVNPLADAGHDVGYMLPFVVTSDGTVDVDLVHVTENPAVKAIEVVELVAAAEAEPDDEVGLVARITNPAGNTADATVQSVGLSLDGGPADDVAAGCADLETALAPGDAVDCRTTVTAGGSVDEVITAEFEVAVDFTSGEVAVASTSDPVSITLVDPPTAPPTGLAATGGVGTVQLDWDDSTDDNVTGFNVYRDTAAGVEPGAGTLVTASPVAASSWADDTVVDGTTHHYVVTAVTTSDESMVSPEASATPDTVRINAGGGPVAATDGGPEWAADDTAAPGHPFLAIASGSSLGGFSVPDRHESLPAYAPQGLFQTERWDGTNGGAPDDLTWEIPVAANGSVTVNLFMANGWTGANDPGERQFDVLIEGTLVLDEFDLSGTYGHATGGMESFTIADDGDGVVTIVFEHGTGPQNPLVNAIEVTASAAG